MSQSTGGCIQTVGPVVFDYTYFQTRFPELAEWTSPGVAQGYFDLATLYLDNTDGGAQPAFVTTCGRYVGSRWSGSPVRNIQQRQILLGLLTAHIAVLDSPLGGNASSNTAGRISSATEGSVSVSFDYPVVAGAEWYSLSKYGMAFFAATARYRMGRYFPAPQSRGCFPYGFCGGF